MGNSSTSRFRREFEASHMKLFISSRNLDPCNLMFSTRALRLCTGKNIPSRFNNSLPKFSSTGIQRRFLATTMATPKHLTGDKAGIDEFVGSFDVSRTARSLV